MIFGFGPSCILDPFLSSQKTTQWAGVTLDADSIVGHRPRRAKLTHEGPSSQSQLRWLRT